MEWEYVVNSTAIQVCKAYGKIARTVHLVHESLHVPLWLRYKLPQTVLCLNGFLSAICAWYDNREPGNEAMANHNKFRSDKEKLSFETFSQNEPV